MVKNVHIIMFQNFEKSVIDLKRISTWLLQKKILFLETDAFHHLSPSIGLTSMVESRLNNLIQV